MGESIPTKLHGGRTAARILRAAGDLVGGDSALAAHLGLSESLLSKLLAGRSVVPPAVLLQAIDLIDQRNSLYSQASQPASNSPRGSGG